MEYRYQRKAAPTVDDEGNLHGRAIPYGVWTVIGDLKRGGFRERIMPGAATKSVSEGDLVLLDNHETRLPLARMSAGTLVVRDGKSGFDWTTRDLVDTTYAQDAVKNARAKNYGGCSFGFEAVKERWTDDSGNPASPLDGSRREVLEMKLPEISICTFPAYGSTMVGVRDQIRAARGISDERATGVDLMAMSPHGWDSDSFQQKNVADGHTEANGSGEDWDPDVDDEKHGDHSFWDPDGDGDCDACPQGDTDHDYWTLTGVQLKAVPGKPLNGQTVDTPDAFDSENTFDADDDMYRSARGGDAPGNGKKPYGNVTYADPGYQSDKKKRYPVDTLKHAKAAWAYIAKAKNAAKYSAQQLASIKAKIKSALSKFGVKTSEAKMAEWEALCDFREMTEGYEFGSEFDGDEFGVLPDQFVRTDDANLLAEAIQDCWSAKDRIDCIERAVNLNLAQMIPSHWGPDGEIGAGVSSDIVRDMDAIYSLALAMNPTKDTLAILDRAQPYLSNETRKSAAEKSKTPPEPDFDAFDDSETLADKRAKMEEQQKHRYEMDRLAR
jgi:HK97 family phage prohead protease